MGLFHTPPPPPLVRDDEFAPLDPVVLEAARVRLSATKLKGGAIAASKIAGGCLTTARLVGAYVEPPPPAQTGDDFWRRNAADAYRLPSP